MSAVQADAEPILQIENLSVSFDTAAGQVKAAENVSFALHREKRWLLWAKPAAENRWLQAA